MSQTFSAAQSPDDTDLPRVNWLSLLPELWVARVSLLGVAAATGVIAAVATITFAKFESEGFYQLQVPSLKTAELGSGLTVGAPTHSRLIAGSWRPV